MTTERRPIAVVDIDGVLADVRHRLPAIHRRPKDWDAFFEAAGSDPVLGEGQALLVTLNESYDVVLVSGRPERCRADTQRWLARHQMHSSQLYLRRDGDRRPARVVKLEIVRALAEASSVAVVVDDDAAVCAGLEAAGFPVLRADWMPAEEAVALHEAQEAEGAT